MRSYNKAHRLSEDYKPSLSESVPSYLYLYKEKKELNSQGRVARLQDTSISTDKIEVSLLALFALYFLSYCDLCAQTHFGISTLHDRPCCCTNTLY